MTREQAIKAIDANWPTENYTMLREALTLAKAALSSAPPDLVALTVLAREMLDQLSQWADDDWMDRAVVGEFRKRAAILSPAPPVAETPEVLPPSGYKSPMQRHYETPEFKAAWAAGKAERDAASPVVAPAPVVETVTVTLAQLQGIEAEGYIDYGIGGCPECKQESGKDHQVDCWIGNGIVALSPRETPDDGGR